MKRIFSSFFFLFVLCLAVTAQDPITAAHVEKRDVRGFHAIETSAGIQVILTKGDKEELAVTTSHPDMLAKVKTTVNTNGTLRISRETNWRFWEKNRNWRIVVYVSYTQLDGLAASSGGSIQAKDVRLESLKATVSSGGAITIGGNATSLDVEGSSGGLFKGYDLNVTNCKADVSSGAGVQVLVSKEISAEASSGGYVRIKGDGLIRNIRVSSGGSIKRADR